MSLFGDFEHHLQIFVGNYIPDSWVMFNWDIYQPRIHFRFSVASRTSPLSEATGLSHARQKVHHILLLAAWPGKDVMCSGKKYLGQPYGMVNMCHKVA